jgi:rhodanese-related sulfurtransferase
VSISITELMKINYKKIIDIRGRESYNNKHIPNAVNISKEELLLYPEKYLNKNETYYIYCQHGYTSKNLCYILSNKGYKTVNIIGGYEAYILSNFS